MANDIEILRRDVSLSETARSFGVALQRDGQEYVACCPFHTEETPSFTIFAGKDRVERYQCFGCGAHGDVVDFVQAIKGCDLRDAIKLLGGGLTDRPNVAPVKRAVKDIYAGIVPIDPVSEIEVNQTIRLYNPKRAGHEWEWGKFKPEMVFPYRRADGSLFGYVLRRTIKGDKETPMVMWVRLPDGIECWSRFPFPKPRPIYGLDALRDGQVIVVEGEKCRDALARVSGRNVVTWSGGTQGVKHTDWKPLAGRSVVIWPDADEPGLQTCATIADTLGRIGSTVRALNVAGV